MVQALAATKFINNQQLKSLLVRRRIQTIKVIRREGATPANSNILIRAKPMCNQPESDMALEEAASCRFRWKMRLQAAAEVAPG